MSVLEDRLPLLYKELHDASAFQGYSWRGQAIRRFEELLAEYRCEGPILDFGCGPKGGLAAHDGLRRRVTCYDPYVEEFARIPDTTTMRVLQVFFSCDVFEHLTPLQLDATAATMLKQMHRLDYIFCVIATRAAKKIFSNGLNVHLSVHPPEWWHGWFVGRFGKVFDVRSVESDVLKGEVTISLVRKGLSPENP